MAVRLTRASSQKLTTASAPDYNGAYTYLLSFRPETVTETQVICAVRNNISNCDFLEMNDPTGDKLRMQSIVGGANSIVGGAAIQPALVAGTYYYLAMVRHSATVVEILQGTTPDNIVTMKIDAVTDVSARAAANTVEVGGLISSSNFVNGRVRWGRLYTRALSLYEIRRPPTTGIWAEWHLPDDTDLTDSSGNGRDHTATGTPTTEADDSVTWDRLTSPQAYVPVMPKHQWGCL